MKCCDNLLTNLVLQQLIIFIVELDTTAWSVKMSETVKKCQTVFPPKAKDDVLKCIILSPTQRYSVYCQRTKKEQKMFTLKKLKSEYLDLLLLEQNDLKQSIIRVL